jgi:hypothetical protein
MGLMDFQNVLVQIGGKTKTIALHVWGDPLTLTNISEYLDIAINMGFKVRLVTSGMPLSSQNPQLLKHPALLQCAISLNSVAQLSNSKQDAYFQTLWDWCEYHTQNNLTSFINLRLWKNPKETKEFVTKTLQRINNHFDIQIADDFSYDASYQLAPRVRFVSSRYFEWPSQNAPIVAPSICHGLCSQLGILSDLRVVPCCMDGDGVMELGNLAHASLDKILSTQRAMAIQDGFKKGKVVEPMCERCGFRERFIPNLH